MCSFMLRLTAQIAFAKRDLSHPEGFADVRDDEKVFDWRTYFVKLEKGTLCLSWARSHFTKSLPTIWSLIIIYIKYGFLCICEGMLGKMAQTEWDLTDECSNQHLIAWNSLGARAGLQFYVLMYRRMHMDAPRLQSKGLVASSYMELCSWVFYGMEFIHSYEQLLFNSWELLTPILTSMWKPLVEKIPELHCPSLFIPPVWYSRNMSKCQPHVVISSWMWKLDEDSLGAISYVPIDRTGRKWLCKCEGIAIWLVRNDCINWKLVGRCFRPIIQPPRLDLAKKKQDLAAINQHQPVRTNQVSTHGNPSLSQLLPTEEVIAQAWQGASAVIIWVSFVYMLVMAVQSAQGTQKGKRKGLLTSIGYCLFVNVFGERTQHSAVE